VAAVAADGLIRAAGGVVWRPAAGGPEACLVHRSRYDDWSLPKGKLTTGEHPLMCAVREVAEETAVRAVPQVRLPSVSYPSRGRPKTVDYWLMRARWSEEFHPNDEVDEVRWTPLAGAADRVSYEHDAAVLRHAASLPPVTAVVLLTRHGYAGERDQWSGPDAVRPLDDTGLAQAHALADLLAVFAPLRLVSASPDRCQQTLAPFAAATGLPIEIDPRFDEATAPDAAAAALRDIAVGGHEPAVVCSQGKLIPRLLEVLTGPQWPSSPGRTASAVPDYATPKGTGWLLAFDRFDLVGMDRVVPVSTC